MAREVIVRMTDDLDRSKLAEETRDLTFEGVIYTLDLTAEHLEELRNMLRPWLDAAHEKTKQVRGKKSPQPSPAPTAFSGVSKEERDRMRVWGRENGFEVGSMGIISKKVIDAYRAAQNGKPAVETKAPEAKRVKRA